MQSPEQIFIPFDIKIRMKPALHQHAGTAEVDRFIDAFADLVDGMNICVRLSGPAVKRAKRADDVADVGIINVAIDDVGNDIARILSLAYLIGRKADADKIVAIRAARCSLRRSTARHLALYPKLAEYRCSFGYNSSKCRGPRVSKGRNANDKGFAIANLRLLQPDETCQIPINR